jgi:hypothetical protein
MASRSSIGMFEPQNWSWPIHIIGMGAIGSQVFFDLYALGFSDIHIWDADLLEERNLKRQKIYCRKSDIGRFKVAAAKDFAEWTETTSRVHAHVEFVDADTELSGVIICGVDSMLARQEIWQAVKRNLYQIPLFMDGRIGGDLVQVYSSTPADVDFILNYESNCLFGDDEKVDLPCWESELSAPPAFVATVVVANLTRFARGEKVKKSVLAHLGELQVIVN